MIRRARASELEALAALWRSVRATHDGRLRVVGRSPLDDAGRPFRLLHMRRPVGGG